MTDENKSTQLNNAPKEWCADYGVPVAFYGIINTILTADEQRLIADFFGKEFTAADVKSALDFSDENAARKFLDDAYARGVVSFIEEGCKDNDYMPIEASDCAKSSSLRGASATKQSRDIDTNELLRSAHVRYAHYDSSCEPKLSHSVPYPSRIRYKINNFFSRLDIVAVNEREVYLSIPEETRDKLEALYFDRYYDALDWTRDGGLPTEDAVITYDETIDFINRKAAEGKNIYLANCDCRSLKNSCGHGREVCVSFDEGINTWGDRGVSKKITLAEAEEVIAEADKEGLIHTSNPHGICNCCTDCCYLFRSKNRRTSKLWPAVTKTIVVDENACIGCGLCVKRCPAHALSVIQNKAHKAEDLCIGCGLCVSVCKPDALALRLLNKE
jgi:Pyruvate/2-oxoacid:ferredoxin oxidoreductase delta subunit